MLTFAGISVLVSWTFCQVFKIIMNLAVRGELSFKKICQSFTEICQDGSFPSAHSSVVSVEFCTCLWLCFEYPSPVTEAILFMAIVHSSIVVRDAVGVRYKTEVNSKVIKNILEVFGLELKKEVERNDEKKLNAKSGHKKHEVTGGILCGFMGTLGVYCFRYADYKYLLLEIPLLILFSVFAVYHYKLEKRG